ncbi:Sulfotransferase domain [Sesbania bispinosa]|nr:Sulfotransferase domain [Sesbania bispinosa]
MTQKQHPESESSLFLKSIQDDVTQDHKEFISTLPMEKGWTERHLYQYQGFWHNPMILQGVLSFQKQFQAHDTDVLLVTIPKSGTTWLKALTFSILNRNRYPPIIQSHHPLVTSSPHALVPFLELELCSDKDHLPDFNSFSSPRLFSTHIAYTLMPKSVKDSSTCKIVYLCRNPKDTLISLWHFANRVRQSINESVSLEEAVEMFCRGVSPYGPFWEHILGYWKESLERPEKEEEAHGMVEDIVKLCSFNNLSNLEVNKSGKLPFGIETNVFFRRGQVGDWKNDLTDEMVEQVNSVMEKKLGQLGLKFLDGTV